MADDWNVGDLALCVDDRPCEVYPGSEGGIRAGGVYQVLSVWAGDDDSGRSVIGLRLDRHNVIHPLDGRTGFHNAIRFRKIPPLTDEERDEFLADLSEPALTPHALDNPASDHPETLEPVRAGSAGRLTASPVGQRVTSDNLHAIEVTHD